MTENLVHNKSKILEEHKKINKSLIDEEDIYYWQNKSLKLKLGGVKDDFDFNKQMKGFEGELNRVKELNKYYVEELNEVRAKLESLRTDDKRSKEKLDSIRAENKFYEEKNHDLHLDFLNKINYLKFLHNPENLMKHLLKFDQETLKNLCIKLNKRQNEKFSYLMSMQQQYYTQMMFHHQGIVPPVMGVINIPSDNLEGNTEEENTDPQHIN